MRRTLTASCLLPVLLTGAAWMAPLPAHGARAGAGELSVPGDCRADGILDVYDVLWVAQIAFGLPVNGTQGPPVPGTSWFRACDADSDGAITVYDAVAVARATVGAADDPGSGGTGSPFFDEGFESGDWSNTDGAWVWNPNPVNVSVSTANPRTGSYSLEFTYPGEPDGEDSTAEQRWAMAPTDELWLEYWLYLPANFHHRSDPDGPENNKFLRVWGGEYGRNNPKGGASFNPSGDPGDSFLYLQWGDHDNTLFGGQADRYQGWLADHRRGSWAQYRFHLQLAPAEDTGQGRFRMWVDGRLKVERRGADWFGTGTDGNVFDQGYLMGWANSGYAETTRFYVDDLRAWVEDPGWR